MNAKNKIIFKGVEVEKIVEALRSMADQYLSDIDGDRMTHDFMNAGEECLSVLHKLSLVETSDDISYFWVDEDEKQMKEPTHDKRFGKNCGFLSSQWEDSEETAGKNYKDKEPVLKFCNHPGNPSQCEGNCTKTLCPNRFNPHLGTKYMSWVDEV